MAKMPVAVKEYMQTVPVAWDEVKFIDGYPGKHYAVARRAGKKWYVAAINGDTVQKQIPLNFSFVGANKTGNIFHTNEKGEIVTESYPVKPGERKTMNVKPNDGFVIVFE
jgi:hypothetical protein